MKTITHVKPKGNEILKGTQQLESRKEVLTTFLSIQELFISSRREQLIFTK